MSHLRAISAASVLLLAVPAWAQTNSPSNINARTVYHTDGTYTESVQDPFTREQREITFNAQKVKIAERVYLINEKGKPVQGNIYDGRGQLKARVQVLFDSFDRQTEQRMLNLQGEVYQRILFTYDNKGKALPAKSINYSNVKSPDIKPAPIDLTGQGRTPGALDRRQGGGTDRGNVPTIPERGSSRGSLPPMGIGPGGAMPGEPAAGATEQQPRKGFFGRIKGIFGGKEKKEEK